MKNGYVPLPDQAERDRFRRTLDRNFSVIAPAGVGKTTSIVARVLAIAEADSRRLNDPVLPRLVVVTYTKKAADEMFSRVRTALDEARPHGEVHAHLAQAFFGTIHSFCQRLLGVAGPLCGFPGEAEIATDAERLWQQFRLEQADPFPRLSADLRRAFALHGSWENVFSLAAAWPAGAPHELPLPGLPPRVDGTALLAVEGKGAGKKNVLLSQERFREWAADLERQSGTAEPLPCPEPERAGNAAALVEAWRETFAPLRRWRAEATRSLAGRVAEQYARFRRRSGRLTFDDLITFARRLLEDPSARDLIRRRGWRVILDEAQDTDPTQFVVLTELARPPGASGCWLDGTEQGPLPGHFCMVGDPQQSIYSDRADLGRYLHTHERLLAEGGEEATFSVTMRCPRAVVETLENTFSNVLRSPLPTSRQVDYVRLENPPQARQGQCVRLQLPAPDPDLEPRAPLREAAYVHALAEWWRDRTPADFGTANWNQVAILCPRNGWLDAVAEAMQAAGLPVRQLSRRAAKAGDPIHAWYAALLTIFAHPRDSFELYGVLRDVFGFSDDALVRYVSKYSQRGQVHPLRLDQPPPENEDSAVARGLRFLHALHREVDALPLYAGVERIVAASQLSNRLTQVPGVEAAGIEKVLSRLGQETAVAESQQLDLAAWARRQRESLDETLESEDRSDEAITLLTAHKSKGLGFDAVVLPFFFRKFATPNETYPCFEKYTGGTPRVLFDGDDRDDSAKAVANLRRFELHERLLYVALTRVKRTLVLFDDGDWWSDLKRQTGESWAELFRVENEEASNRGEWLRLPRGLQPPPDPVEKATEPVPAASESKRSSKPANRFPTHWRRVTPSSLQEHEEINRVEPGLLIDERFPEEVRDLYLHDPAAYGNWWHETMENAPWNLDEEAVRIHFAAAIRGCPDKARGADEVNRLLSSKIVSQLLDTNWSVHVEVPFLWGNTSEKIGYEGYIDLLAVNTETGEWLVLDWKTDRMPGPDPMTALHRAYSPQLAIYADALAEQFGAPGICGLYSTVKGEWVGL